MKKNEQNLKIEFFFTKFYKNPSVYLNVNNLRKRRNFISKFLLFLKLLTLSIAGGYSKFKEIIEPKDKIIKQLYNDNKKLHHELEK